MSSKRYMDERARYRKAFRKATRKAGREAEIGQLEEPSQDRVRTLLRRYLRKQ